MRTTIDLPDDLRTKAKRLAAGSKPPLRAVIEDALREALGRRRAFKRSAPVTLTTFGASGLRPGVGLEDGAALLDLMDSPR